MFRRLLCVCVYVYGFLVIFSCCSLSFASVWIIFTTYTTEDEMTADESSIPIPIFAISMYFFPSSDNIALITRVHDIERHNGFGCRFHFIYIARSCGHNITLGGRGLALVSYNTRSFAIFTHLLFRFYKENHKSAFS